MFIHMSFSVDLSFKHTLHFPVEFVEALGTSSESFGSANSSVMLAQRASYDWSSHKGSWIGAQDCGTGSYEEVS